MKNAVIKWTRQERPQVILPQSFQRASRAEQYAALWEILLAVEELMPRCGVCRGRQSVTHRCDRCQGAGPSLVLSMADVQRLDLDEQRRLVKYLGDVLDACLPICRVCQRQVYVTQECGCTEKC